jgi:predicted Zn finger-like uncharacterized protein
MVPARLACPSCGAGLRFANPPAAGKKVKCPRCGQVFAVPARGSRTAAIKAAAARPARPSRPADEDEDDLDEQERRPVRKRSRKQKQVRSRTPLVVGLMLLGVAVLGAGVTLALVFWPSGKKTEAVAANNPSRPAGSDAPAAPGPPAQNPPGAGPGDFRPGRPAGRPPAPPAAQPPQPPAGQPAPPGPGQFRPPAPPSPPAPPGGGEPQPFAAGRRVYQTFNCARCHGPIGGGSGPGVGRPGGPGRRGPDLSHVGQDPNHTADWLTNYVRNPKAVDPDATMPAFGNRINQDDLKALAEFLASLK